MKTFSLKVRDDDPVAVYLSKQSNVSATLRAIIADYLTRGGAGKPPPHREPEEPPPAPPVTSIDYRQLGEVMYQAVKQALSEVQIAIPANASMNEAEEFIDVRAKAKGPDPLLMDIMAGLDEWGKG